MRFGIVVGNKSGELSKIVLEPWGDEIDVVKGDEVVLSGTGPGEDAVVNQFCHNSALVIYASRGWIFIATLNGMEAETASRVIPAI